jgi:hypothetical protein
MEGKETAAEREGGGPGGPHRFLVDTDMHTTMPEADDAFVTAS